MNIVKIAAAAALLVSMNVQAGVYTDELSKCLVEKTTTQDRTVLVTWVFTALFTSLFNFFFIQLARLFHVCGSNSKQRQSSITL